MDHPNVVKLVEVLDDPLEDFLYLVFELLQLGEVLSIPTDRPLTEERAWSVFRDALLGLEYCKCDKLFVYVFFSPKVDQPNSSKTNYRTLNKQTL